MNTQENLLLNNFLKEYDGYFKDQNFIREVKEKLNSIQKTTGLKDREEIKKQVDEQRIKDVNEAVERVRLHRFNNKLPAFSEVIQFNLLTFDLGKHLPDFESYWGDDFRGNIYLMILPLNAGALEIRCGNPSIISEVYKLDKVKTIELIENAKLGIETEISELTKKINAFDKQLILLK